VAVFIVSVDPVQDVKCTVRAESKEVVAGNVFGFPSFGNHEQLWHDCNRFEVNGKGPTDFEWGEVVVKNEGENQRRNDGKFNNSECVMVSVVCWFELLENHEHRATRGRDEQNFHDSVVHRDECEENIEISSDVND